MEGAAWFHRLGRTAMTCLQVLGTGRRRKPLTSEPPVLPSGTSPKAVKRVAATRRQAWPTASPGRRLRSAKRNMRQCTRTCSTVAGWPKHVRSLEVLEGGVELPPRFGGRCGVELCLHAGSDAKGESGHGVLRVGSDAHEFFAFGRSSA